MEKNEKRLMVKQLEEKAKFLQEQISHLSDIRNNMTDKIESMVKEQIELERQASALLRELLKEQD